MHIDGPHHTTHLLYLHGFHSSPQSAKARQMATVVAQQHPNVTWWCPQLPPSPRDAIQGVIAGIASWPKDRMAVVGSSLGGFYATWVAEQTGCKAVLLNPAVQPARDLEKYIGEQTQWHDPAQHFYFRPEFVEELRSLYCPQLHQLDRYLPIIAKGDELLDWREMQARYQGAPMHVLEGGDHALSNFAALLPEVLGFLALPEASLRHNPPL